MFTKTHFVFPRPSLYKGVIVASRARKAISFYAGLASALFGVSCGRMPVSAVNDSGALVVRAQICSVALGKASAAEQTTFDSLIVQVSASDCGIIRSSFKVVQNAVNINDTVLRIPSGSDRVVKIWTVSQNGTVVNIDSCGDRTVRIDPAAIAVINSILIPAVGSIYIELSDIPTSVDSVFTSFVSTGAQSWGTHVKRSTKLYISLDDIPHNTKGILTVSGCTSGDTLYRASVALTVNALELTTVPLSFKTTQATDTSGGLDVQVQIETPGAVVVSSLMDTTRSVPTGENGTLLITEIMYAVNDSEYVELYNPANHDTLFDTLLLEIDGTDRAFANVAFKANGFVVIGRCALPWADIYSPVQSALDLSSTGNWLAIRSKDMKLMDQVIFAGGSNALEWPSFSGKHSIVLDSTAYSADANNYGRNWQMATDSIPGSQGQFGTPHRK